MDPSEMECNPYFDGSVMKGATLIYPPASHPPPPVHLKFQEMMQMYRPILPYGVPQSTPTIPLKPPPNLIKTITLEKSPSIPGNNDFPLNEDLTRHTVPGSQPLATIIPTINLTANPTVNPTVYPNVNPTVFAGGGNLFPNPNPNPNPNFNPNHSSNPNLNPNHSSNPNLNPNPHPSPNPISNPSPDPDPNSNPNAIPILKPNCNPNPNPNPNPNSGLKQPNHLRLVKGENKSRMKRRKLEGPRKDNWTNFEISALINAKRLEFEENPDLSKKAKFACKDKKWGAISDNLKEAGVERSASECEMKWHNFHKFFKKIKAFNESSEVQNFFRLGPITRKSKGLPAIFSEELFNQLDSWISKKNNEDVQAFWDGGYPVATLMGPTDFRDDGGKEREVVGNASEDVKERGGAGEGEGEGGGEEEEDPIPTARRKRPKRGKVKTPVTSGIPGTPVTPVTQLRPVMEKVELTLEKIWDRLDKSFEKALARHDEKQDERQRKSQEFTEKLLERVVGNAVLSFTTTMEKILNSSLV